jgi:hypothetical protein
MLLRLLRAVGSRGVTTHEIQSLTGSMSPATEISELRKCGFLIPPATQEGKTAAGRKVFRYVLVGERTEQPASVAA